MGARKSAVRRLDCMPSRPRGCGWSAFAAPNAPMHTTRRKRERERESEAADDCDEVAHKSRQHLEAHCAVTGLGDTSGKQANNHGSNKQILWNPTPPHFKKSRCFKLWEEERKREREREAG
ncbi:unnamed protein product [Prorocentrum cordatum]|uniref:Uncharacterized protein n=1 Tax=Prorocentrum cordatum TaxID=2364126 RepID=A0ABN9UNI1_9DINO|nr:unnamed protein product [Polarella glacialis]